MKIVLMASALAAMVVLTACGKSCNPETPAQTTTTTTCGKNTIGAGGVCDTPN